MEDDDFSMSNILAPVKKRSVGEARESLRIEKERRKIESEKKKNEKRKLAVKEMATKDCLNDLNIAAISK